MSPCITTTKTVVRGARVRWKAILNDKQFFCNKFNDIVAQVHVYTSPKERILVYRIPVASVIISFFLVFAKIIMLSAFNVTVIAFVWTEGQASTTKEHSVISCYLENDSDWIPIPLFLKDDKWRQTKWWVLLVLSGVLLRLVCICIAYVRCSVLVCLKA